MFIIWSKNLKSINLKKFKMRKQNSVSKDNISVTLPLLQSRFLKVEIDQTVIATDDLSYDN